MKCPCVRSFPLGQERVEDDVFYLYPRRIGNNILICGKKQTKFPYHCLVGPEWPCMLFTYAIIIVPTLFFVMNVASYWGNALIAICAISGVFTLCLFSAAACSDPGIVFLPPKKEVDKEAQLSSLNNTMECGRCNLDRPRTATHCYECGVCVDQLDHHCPWTGKCIAKRNIRSFRLFLGMVAFHVLLVLSVCIYTLSRGKTLIP